jgi:predicted dithiol-disulfide oxidoreductase (DUF899 family)
MSDAHHDASGSAVAIDHEIERLERQIAALHVELSAARRRRAREPVTDHDVLTATGPAPLSGLFGAHDDLLLVHNMGRGCAYCTLWADGLVGLVPHVERRSALVLLTPDEPATQRAFADARGWPFTMVSSHGSEVGRALGFEQGAHVLPGVSALHRDSDGSLWRTGKAVFGPGDDYCAVWHLFDLLEGGAAGWEPRIDGGRASDERSGTRAVD